MNWDKGFSARYTYAVVDPASWRDRETYDLTGGSITKTEDGLMESGNIKLTDIPGTGEAWIRIYLNATQDGSGSKEAVFTGLLQCPAVDWEGMRDTYSADLYSVLKPASDILLPMGWYAPAGVNGALLAASLFKCGPAPVECEAGAPALTNALIAEKNETRHTMARKIVNAIGWRLRIAGDGIISIIPKATEQVTVLDPHSNDIVELKVSDEMDWYACPNVMRVFSGNQTAVARDDDINSPYSTINRGREIWMEDTQASIGNNESIEQYAIRRLREEQNPTRKIRYARRYLPDVYPGDLVGIHYPMQKIDGRFCVTSQKIELGYNTRTSEESVFYG